VKLNRIAAAAAILALAGAAQAQQSSPWYGELGYTWLKMDAVGTSARPQGIRGIIGWDFHPNFALEGMAAGGVSSDTRNVDAGGGVMTPINFKLTSMYGIYIKPKYEMNQFELFGRLGYAHVNAKATSSAFPSLSTSQGDNDFSWGIGANYHFNPKMYVGLDWVQYSSQSGHKVDGMTLGFGYRF
jgi:opacity protein-like surface antigen